MDTISRDRCRILKFATSSLRPAAEKAAFEGEKSNVRAIEDHPDFGEPEWYRRQGRAKPDYYSRKRAKERRRSVAIYAPAVGLVLVAGLALLIAIVVAVTQ